MNLVCSSRFPFLVLEGTSQKLAIFLIRNLCLRHFPDFRSNEQVSNISLSRSLAIAPLPRTVRYMVR